MCSQLSNQQLIITNLQQCSIHSQMQLYNKMYCMKINYSLFTQGPTHYDPLSASGTYEDYRLQLFLTYIHSYIHTLQGSTSLLKLR
jgi:hypothetical protein